MFLNRQDAFWYRDLKTFLPGHEIILKLKNLQFSPEVREISVVEKVLKLKFKQNLHMFDILTVYNRET